MDHMRKVKKIMVADDDPAILDSLKLMLEFEDYEVITTLNANTVLQLKDELPDLLLLDIWMSGTDGRDVCRLLKQDERTRSIPVILFSASKDIELSARKAGADDFLAKPFEMEELLGKIENCLEES
jgi:DNA-binding response OmpR family regulator